MFLLFWPLMIASIILSVFAIGKKKPALLVVSALFIVPFSFYLASMPPFKGWGLVLPFFYVGAALALRKNQIGLSLVLTLPVLLVIGWIGALVVMQ